MGDWKNVSWEKLGSEEGSFFEDFSQLALLKKDFVVDIFLILERL